MADSRWLFLLRALLPRIRDALVDGLACHETLVGPVPVRDCQLTQFPAQQKGLTLNLAGEIEQSNVEVFHLDAGCINFGERVLDAANRLLAFRFAPRQMDYIQQRA